MIQPSNKTEILSENVQELKRLSDTLKENASAKITYHHEENKENFWRRVKSSYGVEASEELLGIYTPPEHQCPKADRMIKSLRSADKNLENALKMEDVDDVISYIVDAQDNLHAVDDEVDELREAVSDVRDWGQAWKDAYKDLLYELRNKIDYKEYI